LNARAPGPWNLEDDLALIPVQFDAILAEVESGGLELVDESVSAWSVGQQLIHTALVASSLALAIRRILRGGGDPGGAISDAGTGILESGVIPRGVGDAPAPSRHDESPSAEEISGAVEKARGKWDALLTQTDGLCAATDRIPHPALGPMTAVEWVRFQAVHAAHHLKIVDDIRASA
jgi:hypothetical protein